jgi:hypothetical protein
MSATPLSEVQFLNFYLLSLLRSSIGRDPIRACTTFEIDREELARLEALLSPDRILAAVASIGDEALVGRLRGDLVPLLSSPLPLMGALATVRTPGHRREAAPRQDARSTP